VSTLNFLESGPASKPKTVLTLNRDPHRLHRTRQGLAALVAAENLKPGKDLFFNTKSASLGAHAEIDGTKVLNFSSYDYLGLAHHPRVVQAVKNAVDRFGSAAGASRATGGQLTIHEDLDTEIAQFLGVDDALTLNGGFLTSSTTLGHLFGPKDLIVPDAFMHRSALEGIQTSGATKRAFAHNDVNALRKVLEESAGKFRMTLVCIEGVYSTDGDIAPLPEIIALKEEFGCFLMVDEAHSFGVLGETGRGLAEHWNTAPSKVDIWMGTLSKTLVSCGGYIAGSHELVDYLRHSLPGYLYSAALPPTSAAASLEALRLLSESSDRTQHLQMLSSFAVDCARSLSLDVGPAPASPVIPVILRDDRLTVHVACALTRNNICVHPLLFPVVPKGEARLRMFLNHYHTPEDIRSTLECIARTVAGYSD
jgi:8-amino-7-oxononanoate synthase